MAISQVMFIFVFAISLVTHYRHSEEQRLDMPQSLHTSGLVRKTNEELMRLVIKRIDAICPAIAKAIRLRDVVIVDVTIDEQGKVILARPYHGHSLLRDAAVEAAYQWRFTPAKVGGVAAKMTGTINFNFHMEDRDKPEKDIAFFQQQVQSNPNSAYAYYNLGKAYHARGAYEQATKAYKQATSIDPQFALAHYQIGYDLSLLKRYEEAIEASKQAIRIRPDFVEAYYDLVANYLVLQQSDKAIEMAKMVIKIRPDLDVLEHAYINISSINKGMGRTQEAIEAYKELIKVEVELSIIEPTSVRLGEDFSNLVAEMYEKMGRYEDAIDSYKRTIRIAPYSDEAFYAYLNMAAIYEKTGRKEEAMKVYNQMLEISYKALRGSKNPQATSAAYWGLGIIYEQMGKYKDAIEAYKKAIGVQAGWVKPHIGLSRAYQRVGDKEAAYKEYLIVKRLDEQAARELGEILDLLKKTQN